MTSRWQTVFLYGVGVILLEAIVVRASYEDGVLKDERLWNEMKIEKTLKCLQSAPEPKPNWDINFSEKGEPCLDWNSVQYAEEIADIVKEIDGRSDHNFCRPIVGRDALDAFPYQIWSSIPTGGEYWCFAKHDAVDITDAASNNESTPDSSIYVAFCPVLNTSLCDRSKEKPNCPKGWLPGPTENCYKVLELRNQTQKQAEEQCYVRGGHLASVEDRLEHEWLGYIAGRYYMADGYSDAVWLGASTYMHYKAPPPGTGGASGDANQYRGRYTNHIWNDGKPVTLDDSFWEPATIFTEHKTPTEFNHVQTMCVGMHNRFNTSRWHEEIYAGSTNTRRYSARLRYLKYRHRLNQFNCGERHMAICKAPSCGKPPAIEHGTLHGVAYKDDFDAIRLILVCHRSVKYYARVGMTAVLTCHKGRWRVHGAGCELSFAQVSIVLGCVCVIAFFLVAVFLLLFDVWKYSASKRQKRVRREFALAEKERKMQKKAEKKAAKDGKAPGVTAAKGQLWNWRTGGIPGFRKHMGGAATDANDFESWKYTEPVQGRLSENGDSQDESSGSDEPLIQLGGTKKAVGRAAVERRNRCRLIDAVRRERKAMKEKPVFSSDVHEDDSTDVLLSDSSDTLSKG